MTCDEVYLLVNNIEKMRMLTEELGELYEEVNVQEYYWYDEIGKKKLLERILGEKCHMTDNELSKEFYLLRSRLSQLEIERYRWLGKSSAQAVEKVCRELKTGISEYDVAGEVSKRLYTMGIETITSLIAFDERISSYRHPLPTDKKLDKYCMIVVCARKWGLYVSLTRFACIGEIDCNTKEKNFAVAQIDASMILNTRPGKTVKDMFRKTVQRYAELGYSDEWKLHHQGGLTGYMSREYRATEDIGEKVYAKQAFTWNPSITGTKSEDTILVLEDCNEIITHTGEYSYTDVNYNGKLIKRPGILELNR